jgi:hypothetical protein
MKQKNVSLQVSAAATVSFLGFYSLRILDTYEDVSKSSRTGRLEQELQMVQLSATRCSCIAILCVSTVSFATVALCVASQRVIPNVSVYFVVKSDRQLWIHPLTLLDCNSLLNYNRILVVKIPMILRRN